MNARVKTAIILPDGLSLVLFCKGTIKIIKERYHSDVAVICQVGPYRKEVEALGVTVHSVDMYRYISLPEDLRFLFALYRLIRRERFDVVLNFSTKPNIIGTFAAQLAGTKKIISHVVGLGSAFMPSNSLRGRFLPRLMAVLYGLACKMNMKVWFTNPNDRDYFVNTGLAPREKTVLSRNYLDVEEYRPLDLTENQKASYRKELGLRPGDKVVVMVARLIWAKGIKEFAEAAELLRESHPDVKFILVAPPEDESPDSVPVTYIHEKEKTARLQWLGFRTDVVNLYAMSDLAVLPSYYKEGGYPRALLEPMSMGKPIVTTDSEGCRGTVEEGKNGLLVPIKDSRALAAAIASIMGDDQLRLRFGQYSREKAIREFDESVVVDRAIEEMGIYR